MRSGGLTGVLLPLFVYSDRNRMTDMKRRNECVYVCNGKVNLECLITVAMRGV